MRYHLPREDKRRDRRVALAQDADGNGHYRRRGGDSTVDRLPRNATDLLATARDMRRAGASLRSLTEPVVDTASDTFQKAAERERLSTAWSHEAPRRDNP